MTDGIEAPITPWDICNVSGAGSSPRNPEGSGGVNGPPKTTDSFEKHFKREGFDIREIAATDIPDASNQAEDVAFCITDTSEPVNDEIKASHRIAIFAREADDIELSLGEHFDGAGRLLQTEDEAEGVELRNFGVDQRPAGKGVNFSLNRGGRLRDITVRGEGHSNTEWGCGIYVKIPRGEKVRLENVKQPAGAARNSGQPSTHDSIGTLLNGYSHGVLETNGCVYGGFPNNGIYASGPTKQGYDGYAKIKNHTGYNSDRDQVRVGARSTVSGGTFYTDRSKPGFDNHRGVWVRWADGVAIENCNIKTYTGGTAAGIRVDETAGRATIRDCVVEVRSSDPRSRGILANEPSIANENFEDVSVHIDGGRIYGDAPTKDAILIQRGRPDSTIEDVAIDCPNAVDAIDNRSD